MHQLENDTIVMFRKSIVTENGLDIAKCSFNDSFLDISTKEGIDLIRLSFDEVRMIYKAMCDKRNEI